MRKCDSWAHPPFKAGSAAVGGLDEGIALIQTGKLKQVSDGSEDKPVHVHLRQQAKPVIGSDPSGGAMIAGSPTRLDIASRSIARWAVRSLVRNFEVSRSATAEESRKHPIFISHVGSCVSVAGTMSVKGPHHATSYR